MDIQVSLKTDVEVKCTCRQNSFFLESQ